jgi:sec-independent protein translocase protein TatB
MDGFLGISFWEILLIFLIGLILVGPRNLPAMAAKAGRAYRRLKRASQDLTSELTKEVGIDADKKIENPLRKIASDLNSDIGNVKKELNLNVTETKKPVEKAQEQAEKSDNKT